MVMVLIAVLIHDTHVASNGDDDISDYDDITSSSYKPVSDLGVIQQLAARKRILRIKKKH